MKKLVKPTKPAARSKASFKPPLAPATAKPAARRKASFKPPPAAPPAERALDHPKLQPPVTPTEHPNLVRDATRRVWFADGSMVPPVTAEHMLRAARAAAQEEASVETPLAYLTRIQNDTTQSLANRMAAARDALPYLHKKQPAEDSGAAPPVQGTIDITALAKMSNKELSALEAGLARLGIKL